MSGPTPLRMRKRPFRGSNRGPCRGEFESGGAAPFSNFRRRPLFHRSHAKISARPFHVLPIRDVPARHLAAIAPQQPLEAPCA